MKKVYKIFLFLILGVFLISPVLAIDVEVEKVSENEVMIIGLPEPATFVLKITNNGPSDEFSIYTFFGLGFESNEPIQINSGDSKIVELKIKDRPDSEFSGFVSFKYFIQGRDRTETEETLVVNILNLEKAFEIGANSIDPESSSVNVYVHNKANFEFEDLKVHFSSPFFDFRESFDLESYERRNFEVTLDKNDFAKLMAGFYTIKADFEVENVSGSVEETIDFVEKNIVREEEREFGLVVFTNIIKKTNEGNTLGSAEISVKKNILSRIFTTFSSPPSLVKRDGFLITYFWNEELSPGESFQVEVRTNWFIPFLVIILIGLTVYFARKYSKTDLVLRKRVAFVNAKGGEFALKVLISVESKKFIENVKIFDRLPPLVKIYEKFGGELPKRFNKTKKVFEWEFGSFEPGEKRVLSYVIYSKVGVLGKFALPSTFATFTREGKLKEVSSNTAYFLSEQRSEED